MSGKSTKLNKRIVKRQSGKYYKKGMMQMFEVAYGCNLWGRIKIASSIIFKIKQMINIFEKFAPRWRNAVTKYARAIWTNNLSDKIENEYDRQAVYFSREYRNALEKHYAEKGMKVYRGTLSGYVF